MPEGIRILVADDETAQRETLVDILTDAGHQVSAAASGDEALALVSRTRFHLLLTDLRMPGLDGVALLRRALEVQPDLSVILMTAYATVSSAVEAMKGGAYDYLQKPFGKAELLARVDRVAERVALRQANRGLRTELQRRAAPRLMGESPAMKRLLDQLERIARAPGDVLVTGESGTGKELIARALHERGARREGPFVAVNCAAIPEGMAESELFGHEKGAFTHAVAARVGRFEQADGGTLFLDEISSMPVVLQAKLLRVLQERVVERVGDPTVRPLDVRVVAASNRDLGEAIAEGSFREDLYHRVNVLELHAPPLRERGDDVALLAAIFRDEAAGRYGVEAPRLTDALLAFLQAYAFPGNVRELKHLMEKLVALSDGEPLGVEHLPRSLREGTAAATTAQPTPARGDAEAGETPPEALLEGGGISLPEVEERLLREAIRQADGNLSEAARRLGISYKTLRYRASKLEGA